MLSWFNPSPTGAGLCLFAQLLRRERRVGDGLAKRAPSAAGVLAACQRSFQLADQSRDDAGLDTVDGRRGPRQTVQQFLGDDLCLCEVLLTELLHARIAASLI